MTVLRLQLVSVYPPCAKNVFAVYPLTCYFQGWMIYEEIARGDDCFNVL